jgi:hypothetical protein
MVVTVRIDYLLQLSSSCTRAFLSARES